MSRSSTSILLTVLACACGGVGMPGAIGNLTEVTVLSAPGSTAAEALSSALEVPLALAPEPEPLFLVHRTTQFDAGIRRARTLIVIAVLDAGDDAARTAARILGASRVAAVRAAGADWLQFDATFARGQRIWILAARDRAALDSLVDASATDLVHRIDEAAIDRRTAEWSTARGAAAPLAIHDPWGWSLTAPVEYHELPETAAWPHAVQLAATGPTRMVTVFWIDAIDSTRAVAPEFLIGLQRDVLWRMHGDGLVEAGLAIVAAECRGRRALRLDALWENRADIGGGLLRTYFHYDAQHQRLFGVQTQLFAPGVPKQAWRRELEGIARSFELEAST